MSDFLSVNLKSKELKKLTQFKEYAVSHPQLALVDQLLMRAIQESAGFAHVLIYGPSGVGKTTMINQITRRLNGTVNALSNGSLATVPLLLLETRPPDGGAFNRADYYRTALKVLGEPFYERRLLVDIDTEQSWEKKGRSRTKTAQFNDSPELRQALEETMARRGVRAVILDEAQHLMKIGSGASGGKLLDQLDWIKSMTNVTGVLHILIGTYELLNLRNLSGQASRRGLDIHFPRYLFQHEQDRQDFQGVLLALLKQVPLQVEIPTLMEHWFYFYERSIGCVGVLKDWLIRAVAATLHDGADMLTLERLQDHALSLAQCERMAIEAVEGEQKLSYMESRREQLWQMLQIGMATTDVPSSSPSTVMDSSVTPSNSPVSVEVEKKTTSSKRQRKQTTPTVNSTPVTETKTRRKRQTEETVKTVDSTSVPENQTQIAPKKRQQRKKTQEKTAEIKTDSETQDVILETVTPLTEPIATESASPQKKPSRRVGQRKPARDPVGEHP